MKIQLFYASILCFVLSLNNFLFAQEPFTPFKYKIAIIGNPANPDIRYDDSQMQSLKDLGFNMLQVNIAWGARPADEPLNLEDVLFVEGKGRGNKARVDERLQELKKRVKIAKKWGFRTVFHFGAPNVDTLYKILRPDLIDIATEKNSISNPVIVNHYVQLLKRLHQEVPELDDIQLYTFDQEAWIGSEFGNSKYDKDVPLHERITPFVKTMTETWAGLKSDGMLWWEPWEMSAGQIYACLPTLPRKNFGFFLHSNIAEVQLTRPVDVWFRNMVAIMKKEGIPVVGEIFMASANEEVEPLQHVSAPRLVFEQIEALYNQKYLTGVKEYFGLLPDSYDPSLLMAGFKLQNPQMTLEEGMNKLASSYGSAKEDVKNGWESISQGIQLFPWDATWRFRYLPKNVAGISVYHKWDKAWISGAVAPSPSWKSTRRSLFMITEEEVLDPWFYEDIELRSKAGADELLKAINHMQKALAKLTKPEQQKYIKASIQDLYALEQIIRAIQCYCREVNLVFLMRKYADKNESIPNDLIQRFRAVMAEDIKNQEKGIAKNTDQVKTAKEMLVLFNQNPSDWVLNYLKP